MHLCASPTAGSLLRPVRSLPPRAPPPFTSSYSPVSQPCGSVRWSRIARSSEFDVDRVSAPPFLPDESSENREDDVLPDSLADAVAQAAEATALAASRGFARSQVELLLPEFWDPISGPVFPNKGDQERFWRITRRFVEQLTEGLGVSSVVVVYPDTGVAAMLTNQWQDASFRIASLEDRKPITPEDELVVIACPDPFAATDCQRVVRSLAEQDDQAGGLPRPVVLFNQRLSSGDVGLGLNARRLKKEFLGDFMVTYSLRPVGQIGSVFRKYPGLWQVFAEDPQLPGRYKLVSTQPNRPAGEQIDMLIQAALNPKQDGADAGQPASFAEQIRRGIMSMQFFMRSITKG